MYLILLVSLLLLSSRSLAQFVITAHDPLHEELNNATARGLFGFDVKNFLKKNGYPFENHVVTTEDGYILAIHRIPYGRNSSAGAAQDETKPVVLLMHGSGSSAVDFMILGPERSLPLILADEGYDVWLGNNRGNTWSRKHTTLDPDKNETFWDFSFHELGLYDAPAIIDYILNATASEKISYIGHSQGTTQFFAMTSELPEYNDKVNLMMALGPAVYCKNLSNPIVQILKDHYTLVEFAGDYFNVTEFLGHTFAIETALKLICKDESEYQEVCPLILFLLFGFDSDQFDRSIMVTMLDAFPAGNSLMGLKHYLQLVKSGHFRQFDHGVLNNLELYNNSAPPDYDLSHVTAPVAIYYGKNDWLVGTPDVDRLAEELPNVVEKHLIEYDYFNHMDFIVATDIVSLLYFDVINKLNEVNGLAPFTTTTTISTSSITTNQPDDNPTTLSSDTKEQDVGTPGSAFAINNFAQITVIFVLLLNFVR